MYNHKYLKSQGAMKTFQQFNEDVDRLTQRKQQLRQRRLKQMAAHKEKVTAYQESQKRRKSKEVEREQLKREIKREMQTEQSPEMEQTPFNIMKAREQVRGGIAHRRHVHGELAREAGAQQTAKRQRLKALMSK